MVFEKYTPQQKAEFLIKQMSDTKRNNDYYDDVTKFINRAMDIYAEELRPFNRGLVQAAINSKLPLEDLQKLRANGFNINEPDENGVTALHIAAKTGNIELIKLLRDSGADVNAQDKDGKTPLMYLLESDIKDPSHASYHETPIQIKVLNELKEFKSFNLMIEDHDRRNAAEIYAISSWNSRWLETMSLLTSQTKEEMKPERPSTPGFGDEEEFGSGFGWGGEPPKSKIAEFIDIAYRKGNKDAALKMIEVIDYSIDSDTEKNLRDLMIKFVKAGDIELLVKLKEREEKLLDMQDEDGMSPLMHAVEYGNKDLVEALVKKSAPQPPRGSHPSRGGFISIPNGVRPSIIYRDINFELKNLEGKSIMDLAEDKPQIKEIIKDAHKKHLEKKRKFDGHDIRGSLEAFTPSIHGVSATSQAKGGGQGRG